MQLQLHLQMRILVVVLVFLVFHVDVVSLLPLFVSSPFLSTSLSSSLVAWVGVIGTFNAAASIFPVCASSFITHQKCHQRKKKRHQQHVPSFSAIDNNSNNNSNKNKNKNNNKSLVERDQLLKQILLKYGAKNILQESRSMTPEAEKRMLDALYSMINMMLHFLVQKRERGATGNVLSAKGRPTVDMSCPIARLLAKQVTFELANDIIEPLKQKIVDWGSDFDNVMMKPLFLTVQDMQAEQQYQKIKEESADRHKINSEFQVELSTSLATKSDASDFQWDNLSPINIDALKLFDTCKGSVLRGTLVTLPTAMTGITTYLRDDTGGVVQIGLYNYVPGNMDRVSKTEYARKYLAKGTRVEIAEPFTKIFADGNRGIRIDNPREFRIESDLPTDIGIARQEGNEFHKKKLFLAAADSYIRGLSKESFVSTLLSNRAQASINAGLWNEALADAAASLTIRPDCKKTKFRYKKALEHLLQHQGQDKGSALQSALQTKWEVLRDVDRLAKSPEQLKMDGNDAFKKGDYRLAIYLYTDALFASGSDVRAVLSNWLQSALEMEAYQEALAAAAAALRIWADDKAVYRLCNALSQLRELTLAEGLLSRYNGTAKALCELARDIDYTSKYFTNGTEDLLLSARAVPKICPDWASDKLETYMDPIKGRGIRARGKLSKNQAVLVQAPLAIAESDLMKDMSTGCSLGDNRIVNSKSQMLLESTIMNRMKRDQLLARRMDLLYDGKTPRPLMALYDLLNSIHIADAPLLLPPHWEYFEGDSISLTADRVRNIMDTNSFGSYESDQSADFFRNGGSIDKKESVLYSAISIFNHSSDPNCVIVPFSGSSRIVITRKPVAEGDELTISYHNDPDVLMRKWGIESNETN